MRKPAFESIVHNNKGQPAKNAEKKLIGLDVAFGCRVHSSVYSRHCVLDHSPIHLFSSMRTLTPMAGVPCPISTYPQSASLWGPTGDD